MVEKEQENASNSQKDNICIKRPLAGRLIFNERRVHKLLMSLRIYNLEMPLGYRIIEQICGSVCVSKLKARYPQEQDNICIERPLQVVF